MTQMTFVALYAPNQFDPIFFNNINDLLAKLEGFSVVIGADMNAILDLTRDQSPDSTPYSPKRTMSAIQGLVSDYSLRVILHCQPYI